MKKIRKICSIVSLLTLVCGQSRASADDAIPAYTFDGDSYTRLRVQMTFDSPDGSNVFQAKFCPKGDMLGISVLDLIGGNQSAALTMEITAPQISSVNLELYNITTKKKLFGKDCYAAFQRIDFKSPLYLSSQYQGSTIRIKPKLIVADKPSDLFGDSLSGLLTLANAVSSLPAPLLAAKGKIIERTTGQFSSTKEVSDAVDFNLGDDGTHAETWTIPGDTEKGVPAVKIKAFLETVPSYFEEPTSGWDASLIASRNFPGGGVLTYSNFDNFVQSLGSAYTNMVAANDISVFDARCDDLRAAIASNGFSPKDRSLLLWSSVLTKANVRSDPKIDHTDCMSSTFAELHAFSETEKIVARSIIDPPPDRVAATELQMRASIEFDSRFALFWRVADWGVRRPISNALFSWPLAYGDHASSGLMEANELTLENPDQWQTKRPDGNAVLASRVGCYLFLPAKDASANSYMLSLAELGASDQAKEAVVKAIFEPVQPSDPSAKVKQIEIYDPSAPESEVDLLKARYPSGCGASGWSPLALN